MGEASRAGDALLADVSTRRIPESALGIWWLGQASFVVVGAGMTVYVDPFLAEHPRRLVPPPLAPEQVTNADLVLCTHDHADHVDFTALPGIASASPNARILVPWPARGKLVSLGVPADRVVVPAIDEPATYGPLVVTAIPAAHENLDHDPDKGYPYLGYVLQLNGVTLYHSGDCTMYEGLTERLRSLRPDVALLPINGHDWKRLHAGTIGNMSYREAADLGVEVGADVIVPMHFGMFRSNTEPPGNFVNYVHEFYPEQKIHVMARYEGYVYLKG